MPRAYDRRRPALDKDPTRNAFGLPRTPQIDFGKIIAEALANLLESILDNIGQLIEGAAEWLIGGSAELLKSLTEFLHGLTNGEWPDIPAANLVGQIGPWLLNSVSASAITDDDVQLLRNPDFESSIAIAPSRDWSVDNEVYRTKPGSARCPADGTPHGLRSNFATVAAGQKIRLLVHGAASGLVCTGTPITLQLISVADGTVLASTAVGVPDGSDTANWVALPDGSTAGVLDCDWTAPDDGGKVKVLARIGVDDTATAGVIWFDDAVWDIVAGPWSRLRADQKSIQDAITAFITTTWNAITNYTDWATFAAAFNDAWHTLATVFFDVERDEIATIEELLNRFIPGLFTDDGVPHGLVKIWDNWNEQSDAWKTFGQDAWAAIQDLLNGDKTLVQALSALQSAWNTFAEAIAGIQAAGNVTITKIIEKVFGIDTATGQFGQDMISGLLDNFNQLGAALSGATGADAGPWAWLGQIMHDWFGLTYEAHQKAVDAEQKLAYLKHMPVQRGLEETVDSNGDYHSAGVTPISILDGGGFIRISQAKTIGFIQFIAKADTQGTPSCIIEVSHYDRETQTWTDQFTTEDIAASIGTVSYQWRIYNLTEVQKFDVKEGDLIAVLLKAGRVTWHGFRADDDLDDHPTAMLKKLGFNAFQAGAPQGWQNSAPYVGVGVGSADIPPPKFSDKTTTFTRSDSVTLQPWTKFVDLAGFGAGGGGQGEMGVSVGIGGDAGSFGGKTLEMGVDIKAGTDIHVVPGEQTSRAGYFTSGPVGGPTTFTWTKPNGATDSFTIAGGKGGGVAVGVDSTAPYGRGGGHQLGSTGEGAGTHTFNGESYTGGGAALGGLPGNIPAGGGGGAPAFQFGYEGARGQAWITERQS